MALHPKKHNERNHWKGTSMPDREMQVGKVRCHDHEITSTLRPKPVTSACQQHKVEGIIII